MDAKPPFSGTVKEYSLESYVCDENGREFLDSKITWKYNRDQKISEVYQYDENHELSEISSYTYDDNRNLLEITVKTADAEQKQSLAYEYKDNKLIQITETGEDYKIATRFDDYGYPIEKISLGDDGSSFASTRWCCDST